MMKPDDTDKHWEYWAQHDAYWGVCTSEHYKTRNLNENGITEFFKTGNVHIEFVLKTIRSHINADFKPRRCLDFGCGVGRLILPLASICQSVVGVDVSPLMLQESKKNCDAHNISNVSFVLSDDALSRVSGTFDFINSFIVFQHIPPKRGEVLFNRLVEMLDVNGVGVVHLTYFKDASFFRKVVYEAYRHIPFLYGARNLIKGVPFSSPMMQMNEYNLNNIFRILHKHDCYSLVRFDEHGCDRGIFLFFQKRRLASG